MEVGEVIQFYDSDKQFPAWGFGGKIPGGTISHCFNLNGSPTGSEVRNYLLFLVQWFFDARLFLQRWKTIVNYYFPSFTSFMNSNES
jgi:hypothetical protein